MEFPYGHHHHHHHYHHHHSSSGDEDPSGRYPPPGSTHPLPFAGEGFYQTPATAYLPPPQHYPGYPTAGAVASAVVPAELVGKPTFKVYCRANPNFALTIRGGKVVLTYANPTDPYQHWYKDEKYSTMVKDERGSPCFALVNQATGLAVKHSVGESHPVQVIPYLTDRLDESVLWAMGKDLGDGYRSIRMVNNIRLNMDVFKGNKKSGGVRDGMTIVLWQWNEGDNQLWKITPYFE